MHYSSLSTSHQYSLGGQTFQLRCHGRMTALHKLVQTRCCELPWAANAAGAPDPTLTTGTFIAGELSGLFLVEVGRIGR